MTKKNEVIIPLEKPHKDARGMIQKLIDFPVGSVHVITSKKGTVRANHYHKQDDHYCYLASGRMNYYWRPAGSTARPRKMVIKPGQMFYSPPMVEHAMQFTADSVFYVFAKLRRKQEDYENDVVRITLVEP